MKQQTLEKKEKYAEIKKDVSSLIGVYYQYIQNHYFFKLAITAADGARIKQLLMREENPFSYEEIKDRLLWYAETGRCKQYPSIKAALSTHSLNRYNFSKSQRDPDLYE